jgi:hypothetical protein
VGHNVLVVRLGTDFYEICRFGKLNSPRVRHNLMIVRLGTDFYEICRKASLSRILFYFTLLEALRNNKKEAVA